MNYSNSWLSRIQANFWPLQCFRWLASLMLVLGTASAHAWTIIDLGDLNPSGSAGAGATRINNQGKVTGSAYLANGERHGFIWFPNGGMVDLGTLGGTNSGAGGIDNLGYVVGFATTALTYPISGNYRAYLSSINGGSLSSLGTLNGLGTVATGITPDGDRRVIGYSLTTGNQYRHGFISAPNGGPLTQLPKPAGTSYCQPYAINQVGRIVGQCDCPNNCRAYAINDYGNGGSAYLLPVAGNGSSSMISSAVSINASNSAVGNRQNSNGARMPVRWINLPFLIWQYLASENATEGTASAINSQGQIVGRLSFPPSGVLTGTNGHAVLWQSNGTLIKLDQLPEVKAAGWYQLFQAFDINDLGWIVGEGWNAAGNSRAFLLKP